MNKILNEVTLSHPYQTSLKIARTEIGNDQSDNLNFNYSYPLLGQNILFHIF